MSELTIEIWADSRGFGECRGCHAAIEWARVVKSGARMPFDAIEVVSRYTDPHAHRTIEVVHLTPNHWATCPERAQFTRAKR